MEEDLSAVIRPLIKDDLPAARRILRTAFGTFLGAPDPENFWADLDYVYGRFAAEHVASFAAEVDGELVGSNFVTRWGSVGFFGPITVRPDRQAQGIGKDLVEAVSSQLDTWGTRHAGLFTFPQSAMHLALYQKFGFHARFLTAIMAAPARSAGNAGPWSRYSELPAGEREAAVGSCRELTEEIYEGLDLSAEIRTVAALGLGDTILLWETASRLAGFAICHWGPASEAGAGCCFVKFGAVRPGPGAEQRFAATARRLRRARRGGGDAKRAGRGQPGPRGGLSPDGGARVPHRNFRRDHAPAQRAGLQPAGRLRSRRLAVSGNARPPERTDLIVTRDLVSKARIERRAGGMSITLGLAAVQSGDVRMSAFGERRLMTTQIGNGGLHPLRSFIGDPANGRGRS